MEETSVFSEEQLIEMFGEDPKLLEEMRAMNEETRMMGLELQEKEKDHQAFREAAADILAESYVEEGADLQGDLDELQREQQGDRREEERAQKSNILPWRKRG